MQIRNKRVLKNGAVGGYVKQRDGTWRWRIIGHVKNVKGGFKPTFTQHCTTNACKTHKKYKNIEESKYSSYNIKSESTQIKAKLSTLHNTGFFNTYYSKMLRKPIQTNSFC